MVVKHIGGGSGTTNGAMRQQNLTNFELRGGKIETPKLQQNDFPPAAVHPIKKEPLPKSSFNKLLQKPESPRMINVDSQTNLDELLPMSPQYPQMLQDNQGEARNHCNVEIQAMLNEENIYQNLLGAEYLEGEDGTLYESRQALLLNQQSKPSLHNYIKPKKIRLLSVIHQQGRPTPTLKVSPSRSLLTKRELKVQGVPPPDIVLNAIYATSNIHQKGAGLCQTIRNDKRNRAVLYNSQSPIEEDYFEYRPVPPQHLKKLEQGRNLVSSTFRSQLDKMQNRIRDQNSLLKVKARNAGSLILEGNNVLKQPVKQYKTNRGDANQIVTGSTTITSQFRHRKANSQLTHYQDNELLYELEQYQQHPTKPQQILDSINHNNSHKRNKSLEDKNLQNLEPPATNNLVLPNIQINKQEQSSSFAHYLNSQMLNYQGDKNRSYLEILQELQIQHQPVKFRNQVQNQDFTAQALKVRTQNLAYIKQLNQTLNQTNVVGPPIKKKKQSNNLSFLKFLEEENTVVGTPDDMTLLPDGKTRIDRDGFL